MTKLILVGLIFLVGCIFQPKHIIALDPIRFPTRTIPDTRSVEKLGLLEGVPDSLSAMWIKSSLEKLEEGGCLYGILKDSILVIQQVLPPFEKSMQSDSTIEFQCTKNPLYLGTVHTHPKNGYNPSEIDMYHFFYGNDDAILAILWSDNRLSLITRELSKTVVQW